MEQAIVATPQMVKFARPLPNVEPVDLADVVGGIGRSDMSARLLGYFRVLLECKYYGAVKLENNRLVAIVGGGDGLGASSRVDGVALYDVKCQLNRIIPGDVRVEVRNSPIIRREANGNETPSSGQRIMICGWRDFGRLLHFDLPLRSNNLQRIPGQDSFGCGCPSICRGSTRRVVGASRSARREALAGNPDIRFVGDDRRESDHDNKALTT